MLTATNDGERMRKKGHIPFRMCAVCRKRDRKEALLRFTFTGEDGQPAVDERQKAKGRGIYVCREADCREKFLHGRAKRKARGGR